MWGESICISLTLALLCWKEKVQSVLSLFRVLLSLENAGIYSFTFNVYAKRRNELETCSKVRCIQLGQSKRCVVNARSRAGWWRLTYSACEDGLGRMCEREAGSVVKGCAYEMSERSFGNQQYRETIGWQRVCIHNV